VEGQRLCPHGYPVRADLTAPNSRCGSTTKRLRFGHGEHRLTGVALSAGNDAALQASVDRRGGAGRERRPTRRSSVALQPFTTPQQVAPAQTRRHAERYRSSHQRFGPDAGTRRRSAQPVGRPKQLLCPPGCLRHVSAGLPHPASSHRLLRPHLLRASRSCLRSCRHGVLELRSLSVVGGCSDTA
jgi:hypothetical protein